MSGLIVHEWLEVLGGAEKVVDRMAAIFPDAPIVALWNDAPGRFAPRRVSESWMASTPLRRHKALALPLMPATWRNLGPASADWLLCSSHLFAHHARFSGAARNAKKFVYAYTPARYIWEPEVDARGSSLAARLGARTLRPLDRTRAREAHAVASISQFVRDRVERSWGVDSVVIYPPVAVQTFSREPELDVFEEELLASLPDGFLLGASRWVPYKRLDDVIRMGALAGQPVVIAGSGPDEKRLVALAAEVRAEVTFVDRPSQPLLHALYRKAYAFVFPAIEDFGIMPVEAMASGTPVIGSRKGGVAETVIDGESGALIENFSSRDEVFSALNSVRSMQPEAIRAQAAVFDERHFDRTLENWIVGGD